MTDKKNVWVSPRDDGSWQVKREQADRASSVHPTQAEANERARRIAQNAGVERITQGRDGTIKSKDSYGAESKVKDTEH